MLFDLLSFKYLLGEDGENVDQFQVLAHPKVPSETEKIIPLKLSVYFQ